jgi:hypothetical protein
VAHDDGIDGICRDSGPCKDASDGRSAQFDGGKWCQLAQQSSLSGACCADNDDVPWIG